MELKITKGTEWEMIVTCPDCREIKQKQAPYCDINDIFKQFGIIK